MSTLYASGKGNPENISRRKPMKRLFVLAILFLSGCATIITGTTQEVSFQSNPDGAQVSVSGRILGRTPLTMNLKKKKDKLLYFKKKDSKDWK